MIAVRQERDSLGRRYGKVPLDFLDRLAPDAKYAGAALPVYLCLEGFGNATSYLAWPLVGSACERICMSNWTWMGAIKVLADARLIRKAPYKTSMRGTIAYRVRPIDGPWTMLNTDLAWARFIVSGWRLLLRLAYHDKQDKTVAKWAAEAGVSRSRAQLESRSLWPPDGLRTSQEAGGTPPIRQPLS